jgi:predicted DNA-binding transcriptional regulator AlpA
MKFEGIRNMKSDSQAARLLEPSADRILRFPEFVSTVGLKRSSIYDRLDPKSPRFDPTFPRPIQLGARARAIGFSLREAEAWVAARIAERDRAAA